MVQPHLENDPGVHHPPPCPNPAQKADGDVPAGPHYGKLGDQYVTERSLFRIKSSLERKKKIIIPSPSFWTKMSVEGQVEARGVYASYKR